MIKTIISLLAAIFIISCSSSNSAGGSDLPNGKIAVTVTIPDSINSNTSVSLKSLKITSEGEVVIYEDYFEVNKTSLLEFENVPVGNYVLTAVSHDSSLMAIKSRVELEDEERVVNSELILSPKSNIIGRVLNSSSCKVLLPGINKSTIVDADGFYTLNNVPKGDFEIAFIESSVLSIVSLETKNNTSFDTLFIQDVKVINDTDQISQEYELYENSLLASAYLEPEVYSLGEKPDWYSGKDFSLVNYLKVDTSADIQKTVWHFPVIAGVTQQTSDYYGGAVAVIDSIKNQIKKVDSLFKSIEGINADIRFTLDSIYLIPIHPDSEVVEPPEGYAVRILYDGFKEGTRGNWIKKSRVIVHNSSAEVNGTFSDDALKSVMWEFGLFRGCSYISSAEVYASKNKVNGLAFSVPSTVMNLKSTTDWIDANIHIINYSAGNFSIIPSITLSAFPQVMGIKVLDYDNKPVSNVTVNVYGAEPFPDSIDNIIDFSGLTDISGKYTFDKNPYVTEDNLQHVFDNLLIEVFDGNNKFYTWLPHYKMYEWWFEHPGEEFFLNINIL